MSAIRAQARGALIAAITAELPGVPVDRSYPGNRLKKDHVYADRTEGTASLPLMQAGEHETQDEFRILIQCQATRSGRSSEAAETECGRFMEAVRLAVARAWLPGGLLHQLEELGEVDLGESNGPDAEPLTEGYVAWGEVEVTFVARIVPEP